MEKINKILIWTLALVLIVNIIFMYPNILSLLSLGSILILLLIMFLVFLINKNESLNQYSFYKYLAIILALVLVISSLYGRFTEDLGSQGLIWRWFNTIIYIVIFLVLLTFKFDKKKERAKPIYAKKGILSDKESIACNVAHELEYILGKYNKRKTKENLEKMRIQCKLFKKKYNSNDREAFYQFLERGDKLSKFEDSK